MTNQDGEHGACSQRSDNLPVLDDSISYDEFFEKFMIANQPCLFKGTINQWRSIKEWVDSNGRPNFQYLSQHFGDTTVPVSNCGKEQYGSQPKADMLMRDFIKYWQEYIEEDYNENKRCLYLKDWHFTKIFPDYNAYETPVYFTSDWLNEFWDCTRQDSKSCDDYRFVYMGPKNSWTPLHADVFRSFSWSANICGSKRWLIYPPGEEEFLRDKYGNLPFDVTSSEMNDKTKFPKLSQLKQCIEVIQRAGEVIFIPSGWHHQVFNLDDTISINHNWFNGCNVNIVWEFLKSELLAVQRSIYDCKDMDEWDEQCQLIMKANTGIDYAEFVNFLTTIARPRMRLILEIVMQHESSWPKLAVNPEIDQHENCIDEDDIQTKHYLQVNRPIENHSEHVSPENNLDLKVFDNIIQANDSGSYSENQSQKSIIFKSNSADRLLKAEEENILKLEMNKGHGCRITYKRSNDEVDCEMTSKIDPRRCLLSNDRRHLLFDLLRLKDVMDKLLMEPEFKFVKLERLIVNPVEILDKVKSILAKVENSGLSVRL
ncbi:2-oxoglutarate and iron-dependent oxygenase JMJD4-like [Antedon mediterranea]|uniref:2-oxoglutarate and iron-dependent oxygenase JMJD4-like n=1 Tax=Antedon mediterranea TaxID=105859 RepID=UPI003AF4C2F4